MPRAARTCDVHLHLAGAGANGVGGFTDVGPCHTVAEGTPEEKRSVLGLHTLWERAVQPAGAESREQVQVIGGVSRPPLPGSQPFCQEGSVCLGVVRTIILGAWKF